MKHLIVCSKIGVKCLNIWLNYADCHYISFWYYINIHLFLIQINLLKLIVEFIKVYPVQHILQAYPGCVDSHGLHHPAGHPVWQQATAGACSLWSGCGLAHYECSRHFSLYVGQTQGKLWLIIFFFIDIELGLLFFII